MRSVTPFMRPLDMSKDMIKFEFVGKPLESPHVDKVIKVAVGSPRIDFNPIFI